jgi:putative ABC transport system permease protein
MSVAHARDSGRRGGHTLAMAAGGASLLARRLRLDPGPALTMLVLVAATSFLFAALPRLFNGFADDGLRYTIAQAPFGERNPSFAEAGRIPASASGDPLANVVARTTQAQHAVQPAALDEHDHRHAVVIRSPMYSAPTSEGIAPFVTLRVPAGGFEDNVRVVAGRLPRARDQQVSTVIATVPERPRSVRVPLIEIALSTNTARELEAHVGERRVLTAGFSELQARRIPLHDQRPIAVEIVGLFDVTDPSAPFWFGDPTVDRPNLEFTPDLSVKSVYAQAIVAPAAYPVVLAATSPFRLLYEHRYLLDERRIDGGRVSSLRAAANEIDARYAGAGPLEPKVTLGLGPILDRFRSASSQAKTLLAVAALGLLACALACLGLLGALTYERRRTETTLSRVRGASPLQSLGVQAAEAALIAVPAGALGWAVAVLTIDARGSSLSGWLSAAVVVGTIVLLVASIAGVARRPLGSLEPAEVSQERRPRRRLAVEAAVVLAALIGVYLLRRRGLEASGFGASGSFDPFLAAVPVLLGLACGIALLRLQPYPLRAAARLAQRTKGLALHLGLSRAARQQDTSAVPALVLVVALSIAAFSAAMAATIRSGQDATGWRAVGADVRIDAPEGGSLPESLVSRLESSGSVAPAYVQDADISTGTEAILLAIDPAAYRSVVAGTPAAVDLRAALGKPAPIPTLVSAVVSTRWPTPGSFQLSLPGQAVSFITVGDRARLPGIPSGTPFAVVSLDALRTAAGELPVNRLYVSHVGEGEVAQAVQELAPGAKVTTRAAVARSLRASPLVDGVLRGFDWAVVVAAIYAAVAVVLLVLIAARSRARDLALVRTMGGGGRDVLVVSLIELGPLVVLGVVLGLLLGIAVPYLIEPGLDLAFFTGTRSTFVSIPGRELLEIAVALLVLLLAAALLVGLRTRRADLGRVLRVGER